RLLLIKVSKFYCLLFQYYVELSLFILYLFYLQFWKKNLIEKDNIGSSGACRISAEACHRGSPMKTSLKLMQKRRFSNLASMCQFWSNFSKAKTMVFVDY